MQDIPVITIDGPAASGKGTIAARVARSLGFHYLDSGALYRLATFAALKHGISLDDAAALAAQAANLDPVFDGEKILFEGEDVSTAIRSEAVSSATSQVAAIPEVREALFNLQRRFARAPGLVADGRDMGTVVFPQAQVKIFLDASPEVRARRRQLQLEAAGKEADFEQILKEITERDERDRNRPVAPLKPAEDALLLDSTDLSIEEVFNKACEYIRSKMK